MLHETHRAPARLDLDRPVLSTRRLSCCVRLFAPPCRSRPACPIAHAVFRPHTAKSMPMHGRHPAFRCMNSLPHNIIQNRQPHVSYARPMSVLASSSSSSSSSSSPLRHWSFARTRVATNENRSEIQGIPHKTLARKNPATRPSRPDEGARARVEISQVNGFCRLQRQQEQEQQQKKQR